MNRKTTLYGILAVLLAVFICVGSASAIRIVETGGDAFVYEQIQMSDPDFGDTLYKMSGDATPVALNTIQASSDGVFDLLEAAVGTYTGTYYNRSTDLSVTSTINIWYPELTLKAYLDGTTDSIDGKTIEKQTEIKFIIESPKVGPADIGAKALIYFTTPVGAKTTNFGGIFEGIEINKSQVDTSNFQYNPGKAVYAGTDAVAGTYVAQAQYDYAGFVAIPDKYKKSNTISFTIQSDSLTITANKDSVVRSNPFTVVVQGAVKTNYEVFIDGFYENDLPPYVLQGLNGVDIAAASYVEGYMLDGVQYNSSARITTDASGKRTVQYNTLSVTEDKTYTIKVEKTSGSTDYDIVKVKVEKGAVTITTAGDRSYYIGEEIKFTGTSTNSSSIYLFVTGPNLEYQHGIILKRFASQVPAYDATGSDTVSVKTDNTWEYKWDTYECGLDIGTYTIYATSILTNGKASGEQYNTASGETAVRISDSEYAAVSVNLKSPEPEDLVTLATSGTSGYAPLFVRFYARTDLPVTSSTGFRWDVHPDESYKYGRTLEYTYEKAGIYTVTLRVTPDFGPSIDRTVTIEVTDRDVTPADPDGPSRYPAFAVLSSTTPQDPLYTGTDVSYTLEVDISPDVSADTRLTYSTELENPEWSGFLIEGYTADDPGSRIVSATGPSGTIPGFDLIDGSWWGKKLVLTVKGTVPGVLSSQKLQALTLTQILPETGIQYRSSLTQTVVNAVIEPAPTITLSDPSECIVNTPVHLTGTGAGHTTLYLSFTGSTPVAGNLDDRKPVISGSPDSFTTVTVDDQDAWACTIDTGKLGLEPGYYTVTVSAKPELTGLSASDASSVSFTLRNTPALTSHLSASAIAKGDSLYLSGTVEGDPDSVTVYTFGPNKYLRETVPVLNGSFATEMNIDSGWSSNQYYVVIEHPMKNGVFDVSQAYLSADGSYSVTEPDSYCQIILFVPGNDYLGKVIDDSNVGQALGSSRSSFPVWAQGMLQGSNAADALSKMIETSYIDDVIARQTFTVQEAWIEINNPGDQRAGSTFTISGTTNLQAGDQILIEIFSSGPIDKIYPYTNSYYSQSSITVSPGDGTDNTWFIDVDATNIKPDEYTIRASGIEADVTFTTNFNLVSGPPVTDVPRQEIQSSIRVNGQFTAQVENDLDLSGTGSGEAVYLAVTEGVPGKTVTSTSVSTVSPDETGRWETTLDLTSPVFEENHYYTIYAFNDPVPDTWDGYNETCIILRLLPEGGITLKTVGGPSYFIGETVTFTGKNKESGEVYLFITGPNLHSDGSVLTGHPSWDTPAREGAPVATPADGLWTYEWDTSDCGLDTGTYTIYATPVLTNGKSPHPSGDAVRLSDTEYAALSITLRCPYLTLSTDSRNVPKGGTFTLRGEATGDPDQLTLYIFGPDTYQRTEYPVTGTSYIIEDTLPDTAGLYYLVLTHPMFNGINDIVETRDDSKTTLGVQNPWSYGGESFIVEGDEKLSGSAAATALTQMISYANIDDIYAPLLITTTENWAEIDTIRDQPQNRNITITGRTNIRPDTLSLTIDPGAIRGTPSLIRSENGISTWQYITPATLGTGTYTISAYDEGSNLLTTSMFRITDSSGTETPEPAVSFSQTSLQPVTSETVLISGKQTECSTLYLYLTSNEHPGTGIRLDTGEAVTNGDASSFTKATLRSDGTWMYNWMVGSRFTSGSYTLYAVNQPADADHLSGTLNASIPVTIQDGTTIVEPVADIHPADSLTIRGTVSTDAPAVKYYLIGSNTTLYGDIPVSENAFETTIGTSAWDPGTYTLFVQTRTGSDFDIAVCPGSNNGEVIAVLPSLTEINPVYFVISGKGKRSGDEAVISLTNLFTDPRVNDQYCTQTFRVLAGPTDTGLTSLSLIPGWNFISVPKTLTAGTGTAEKLFASVHTGDHQILLYNTSTGAWDPVRADDRIEPLSAYWIYTEDPATLLLHYPDTPSVPAVKTVYPGWNAVGLSAAAETKAGNALAGTGWRTLIPWKGGRYETAIINGGTDESSPERYMTTGNGYWLYVAGEGTLTGLTA